MVSSEWDDYFGVLRHDNNTGVGVLLDTQVKYVYCDGRRIGMITRTGDEQRRYYIADIWNGEQWMYTIPHAFPDFDVCRMAIEKLC